MLYQPDDNVVTAILVASPTPYVLIPAMSHLYSLYGFSLSTVMFTILPHPRTLVAVNTVTESDITVISVTTGGTGIDFSGIRSVNCVINYQYKECILPAGGVATVTGSENGPVPISLYEATIQV